MTERAHFSADLIARYGSPLYAYDEAVLRSRCRELRTAFVMEGVRFLYAVKANANPSLLRIIAEEGIDFDAVSEGEVAAVRRVGIASERLSYNGNNVTAAELAGVARSGVTVIVDSLSQLETLGRLGIVQSVGLRVNTGFGGGHHDHVITGGPDSKFGVEPKDIEAGVALAARYGLRIEALHQHIGSGILDPLLLTAAATALLPHAKPLNDLKTVDFGGGFGIPYREHEQRLDLVALAASISPALRQFRQDLGRDVTFCFEPGRFVVAECGALLVTVTSVKRGAKHVFVGTDSGFNHLIRPTLYGAFHAIENLSNQNGKPMTVRVAGNICESGDLFAIDRELPECREGDVLVIRNAGAYGFAMASTYNLRPRPAEVLIADDGTSRVIRRRETVDDLLA